MNNDNSAGKITYRKDGNAASFEGAAVNIYRAAILASSIGLWIKTGIKPTRGIGITKMLEMAKGYTGQTYTRKRADIAVTDLNEWVQQRKAATPSETTGGITCVAIQ